MRKHSRTKNGKIQYLRRRFWETGKLILYVVRFYWKMLFIVFYKRRQIEIMQFLMQSSQVNTNIKLQKSSPFWASSAWAQQPGRVMSILQTRPCEELPMRPRANAFWQLEQYLVVQKSLSFADTMNIRVDKIAIFIWMLEYFWV